MATIATDFGLSTDGIFLRAPRLNKDDIGERLSDRDINLIEDFEDAWKQFLLSRPGTLPPGQKIKNFRNMQTQMNEVEGKTNNVCMELQHQLDFFGASRDKLEVKYKKQKDEATLHQKAVVKQLEKELDDSAVADQLLSEVLPWEHYFENLESNTTTVLDGSVSTGESRAIRPSDEALYLANIDPSKLTHANGRYSAKADQFRAYRIDNALLKTKVAMLKREADRLERNVRSDRFLSNFLMENNVFGVIASSTK
jgi:hypothetical protein